MIDGITIKYEIADLWRWRDLTNISLYTVVENSTGEVKTKKRNNAIITTHHGKFETFDLIVKEVVDLITGETHYYLSIKGSLHKNHFNGKNYLPFTWDLLQQEINHLSKSLFISPAIAAISNLEVGLNIQTPFAVTPFIKQNIICYKGNPFNQYNTDNKGMCLGIYRNLSQYVVKIYDKGLQNDLPQNLMRFEKRFLKMQVLNKYGIKSLVDLQDRTKIYNLLPLLVEAWKNVLIYDIEKDINALPLKPTEMKLLNDGINAKFWEQLKLRSVERFKYQCKKFKKIVAKHGNNYSQKLSDLTRNEWQFCFQISPNLPLGKPRLENRSFPEFTIKINGKNGENPNVSKSYLKPPYNTNPASWSQDILELESYFDGVNLPAKPVKLNECSIITNISLFVNSHFATIKANEGKKIFLPHLNRLKELRKIINTKLL